MIELCSICHIRFGRFICTIFPYFEIIYDFEGKNKFLHHSTTPQMLYKWKLVIKVIIVGNEVIDKQPTLVVISN